MYLIFTEKIYGWSSGWLSLMLSKAFLIEKFLQRMCSGLGQSLIVVSIEVVVIV